MNLYEPEDPDFKRDENARVFLSFLITIIAVLAIIGVMSSVSGCAVHREIYLLQHWENPKEATKFERYQ